jgi:AraC-like DNA-binding protein
MVHAALCDPRQAHMSIARLAERSGFHCPAAFNRTFRGAFGATPGEVREAAGQPDSLQPRTPGSLAACRDFLDLLFSARTAWR